jgi:hypothetical protein
LLGEALAAHAVAVVFLCNVRYKRTCSKTPSANAQSRVEKAVLPPVKIALKKHLFVEH